MMHLVLFYLNITTKLYLTHSSYKADNILFIKISILFFLNWLSTHFVTKFLDLHAHNLSVEQHPLFPRGRCPHWEMPPWEDTSALKHIDLCKPYANIAHPIILENKIKYSMTLFKNSP